MQTPLRPNLWIVEDSWFSSDWSWSSSCGRQSVDQFVWVSGLPMGPLTRFYLALLFSSDNYLILLSKASSLTRKRVCSLHCNHSLVPITILYRLIWDCVPFLSPLTTRRDFGGGILTRLHTGASDQQLHLSSSTRRITIKIPLSYEPADHTIWTPPTLTSHVYKGWE
jgi:hypothetical protein